MSEAKYPPGWDEARVKRVVDHYESQTDDQAVAEDEASWDQTPLPPVLLTPRKEWIMNHSKGVSDG